MKHASNVPGCAELITQLFHEAGFEDGVFTWLPVGSEMIEDIINDPVVQGVTLTGSEEAGRKVAEQAGAALKPSVLELGGIDPLIVLDDADIGARWISPSPDVSTIPARAVPPPSA
ncbi:aldehyde dehydrogenase family protein [Cobetia marina]